MTVEEVLKFFDEVWMTDGGRARTGVRTMDDKQRIRQKYLEHVTDNPKQAEIYSTMLGEMYIDSCFV